MTDWIRDYIEQGEEPVEPISDIFYPIVNGMDEVKVVVAEGHDYANHEIIGVISTSFYWRAMIRGSLSPGSDGIVVVFDSPCNDPFTYEINGPSVKYLGVGDKHDPKYDRLGVHGKLFSLVQFSNSDSIYSGAGLDEEFCPFTLNVYPSDVMKAECTTKIPLIFAWSTALIFALTALVFCLYDLAVERRQKLVLKTALRSTALVSSLFPSTVRERLYQSESEKGANRNQSLVSCRMATTENDVNTSRLGSPIAELYPETTVMFADIAGFTAWSSERQPHQVFHLLETLYGAFDRIAKQRGVFKVETIGDSYVAVVGLPTPRKQHAVVMARFAKDCRDKMNELTRELEKTLGPVSIDMESCEFYLTSLMMVNLFWLRQGTADLALRLGLNSGPATAGVFRGEKARFQLFGDVSSVNPLGLLLFEFVFPQRVFLFLCMIRL